MLDDSRRFVSERRWLVLGLALIIVLFCITLFGFDGPRDVHVRASGSFAIDAGYPSQNTSLATPPRYGSWNGSDANVGELTSEPFTAPGALVMSIAGYPTRAGNGVYLKRTDTGAIVQLLKPGADLGESWRPLLIPVAPEFVGKTVELHVVDGSKVWGGWLSVSAIRAARLDERLLNVPVLSRLNYVGFLYLALLLCGVLFAINSQRLPAFSPWYLVLSAVVVAIAFLTGWTNADLATFATWGREVLLYGPSQLYEAPIPSDSPPLNPAVMVVPAFLEALFRSHDSHLDPFLFKLLPIASLITLPLLLRAAVLAVNMDVSKRTFLILVLCTVGNPFLIYSTAIWGQNDVFVADLMVASFIALTTNRIAVGSAIYVASVLTKPQSLLALPIVVVLALRSGRPLKIIAGVAAIFTLLLPVTYPHGGLIGGFTWLSSVFAHAFKEYAWATIGAGNFPAVLSGSNGGLTTDSVSIIFGIPVRVISAVSVLAAIVIIGIGSWLERRKLGGPLGLWYFATSCMLVYWLATNMHERYITYGAIFTIGWAFVANSRRASYAAASLSLAALLQMLVNWNIDLGWGKTVDATLLQFVSRSAYAAAYSALNFFGLVLLLASRLDRSKFVSLWRLPEGPPPVEV